MIHLTQQSHRSSFQLRSADLDQKGEDDFYDPSSASHLPTITGATIAHLPHDSLDYDHLQTEGTSTGYEDTARTALEKIPNLTGLNLIAALVFAPKEQSDKVFHETFPPTGPSSDYMDLVIGELEKALKTKDTPTFKAIFASPFAPFITQTRFEGLLYSALKKGQEESAELLLNLPKAKYIPPLDIVEMIRLIGENGAPSNLLEVLSKLLPNDIFETAVERWALEGNGALLTSMLALPEKPISAASLGRICISAAQRSDANVFDALIDSSQAPMIPIDNFGKALQIASKTGCLPIVQKALSSPAAANLPIDGEFGLAKTLTLTARHGQAAAVDTILSSDRSPDILMLGNVGVGRALIVGSIWGHSAVVRTILNSPHSNNILTRRHAEADPAVDLGEALILASSLRHPAVIQEIFAFQRSFEISTSDVVDAITRVAGSADYRQRLLDQGVPLGNGSVQETLAPLFNELCRRPLRALWNFAGCFG